MSLPTENVLDFPRPAICEAFDGRITVEFGGQQIADTTGAWRALETYHPPTYYLPMADIADGVLVANRRRTMCEWKGQASYFDIVVGGRVAAAAGWTYRDPTPTFKPIAGMVAIYAEPMDRCTVAGIDVIPQPGNFYGGWVTPNVEGPVKGAPGTRHW
ncbi:MAG: DUF427 domain-containing protein [Pseudomonadota bacterium]